MRVAIVFYSKTGITKEIVLKISNMLKEKGIAVDVFELKPLHDYGGLLYLNPRLIYETLIRKSTEITVIPYEPKLENYDILILASPIWCETITPPIREFIRRHKFPGKKTICITTSMFPLKYSKKLKKIAEKYGKYKVIYHVNISKGKPYEKILSDITQAI